MNLLLNKNLGEHYVRNSQKIRVMSETWARDNIFCPNCGLSIFAYENNKAVADLYCGSCSEDYELKSEKGSTSKRVTDGAYGTMIQRLQSQTNPNFFFLNYDVKDYQVINFAVIPKHFFVPEMIIPRKKGLPNRPNHIMCSIDLTSIPESGKIFYIKNKEIKSKNDVLDIWQRTLFLKDEKELSAKGWLLDIMRSVEKIDKQSFSLDDVYKFEKELQILHPENHHIKDKIRQQLQVLRDKNYLRFLGSGRYELIK